MSFNPPDYWDRKRKTNYLTTNYLTKDGYKLYGKVNNIVKAKQVVKNLRKKGFVARYIEYIDKFGSPYYLIYRRKRKK